MHKHKHSTTSFQLGKRRASKGRLVYANNFENGIQRRRHGRGFVYSAGGKPIRSESTHRRIKSLAIPPAWEEVWIARKSNSHIQAKGRDSAGRTQYIYHERWQAVSSEAKYDRLHLFAKRLPRIRRRVRKDLRGRKLTRERVLAAVVRLLDKAYMRIGNEHYAKEHGSRGATTLMSKHVDVNGFTISLDFPGKSAQKQEIEFTDKKTAQVIRQCEDIAGQYLFSYQEESGEPRRVDSTDVNDYLSEIAGESITAKDFRTWWGSVLAISSLADVDDVLTAAERTRRSHEAVAFAAESLGNTKTVCRKSYIHPGILAAAETGELPSLLAKARNSRAPHTELTADETLFANLLPHLEFS